MRWVYSLVISVALGGSCWATTATMAWQAPPLGVPDTYRVYRQVQGQAWKLMGVVNAAQRWWTDPSTAQGTQCYRVTATAGSTESGPSNTLCLRCNHQRCRAR